MTYATYVAVALLSLVNVLVIARALGPTGRGDVAFLTTIGGLTTQMSLMGFEQAAMNFAGRDPRLTPALASTSLLLAGALGATAAGVVALLVALFPGVAGDADRTLLWVVLASLPLLIFGEYLRYLASAHYRFKVMNAAYLLPSALNAALNTTLAVTGALTVAAAVAIWVAGQVLAAGFLTWYVLRRLHGFGRPDGPLARRGLGFGIKAHAGRVMIFGNYRLDQWILGGVSGSRELGHYSVAVAWSEALFFLPQALVNVQRPDLVRANRKEARESAAIVLRASVLITAVLAAAMLALAPFLCVTVFGSDFEESVDDLRILTFGAFGIAALKLLGNALTAQRRPLLETAAIGVAFALVVVLDILLIPPHGAEGAAVASTIAYSAGGVAVVLIFARALGARPRDLIPRPRDVSWLASRVLYAARRRRTRGDTFRR
ncbi:MAG: oligosaccharide flippase family protein [Thermoleophilaceae bacterium]